MRLGLGNNLVKTAFPIGTSPSLDLAFALDRSFTTDPADAGKALITSRRGPAAKFSRGSGATQVNAAGLIEYAPENLATWSEKVDDSSWTKSFCTINPDATSAPNGLIVADKIVEDTSLNPHGIRKNTTVATGTAFIASIYLKAGGRNFAAIYTTAPTARGRFLSIPADGTGAVLGNITATDAVVTLRYITNGWYRATIEVNSWTGFSAPIEVYPAISETNASYIGDGVSGIFVWGAQLERASTARTYYPTTSAAFYGPRFDHDPVTGLCKGLLIEESRTNFITRSEELNDASWTKSQVTVNENTTTSPSGIVDADKVVESTALSIHRIVKGSLSAIAGTVYSVSVYAKADGRRYLYLNAGGFGSNSTFDLESGVVSATQNGTASITNAGNGWWRCVTTGTAATTQTTVVNFQLNTTPTALDSSYTGDGTSGLYLWGAQLEAGAFPTSYIPTTIGTAIRSADICSIEGTAFTSIWNGVDATIFFIGSRIANQVSQTNWELSSGTTATRIASDRGATTERIVADATGIMNTAAFTTLSEYKIATALRTGDYAVSFNGASALTSSSAFVLTLNRLTIGMTRIGSGQMNGWIQSIKFYKKRLSNAKLQTLTAP